MSEIAPFFRFGRTVRTLSSEVYDIHAGDTRVGQANIHYAGEVIYANLVVELELDDSTEQALVNHVDQEIVSSYLPSFARTDLIVTVFHGRESSHYSDVFDEATDDDFDEIMFDEFDDDETRH